MTIEYNYPDLVYSNTLNMNLFRFHIAKTKEDVILINEIFRKSKSFSEFKKLLRESTFNYWDDVEILKKEYSYALLSCYSSSCYHRLINDIELFTHWKISFIDDRNHPIESYLLDGIILPATSEAWNFISPPNFLGDISSIFPRMKHEVVNVDHAAMNARLRTFLDSTFWKECVKNGYGINRGIEKLVIEENERYLQSL